MTTKIRSPTGLEICTLLVINLILLSTFTNAAPLQETVDIQEYSEGCYYNYNHYNEGDRISTNEPCLNCTCHNKMLMCYLRVCPFTKPIGHDCVVEKREDQCCPIITCPEVPVELSHQVEPGTELAIPEKYGCTIDNKFYVEGAQVPSNPNKPCELCYCIKNRTSCLMQECTLHIDGCQPIYNKDSCCPVRYNCDHENELLDDSSTVTTVRPTTGFLLTTASSLISAECYHNGTTFADGSLIKTANSCENCYCMHGDIVCAVQKCDIPSMEVEGKVCKAGELLDGECCPSNYICEDVNELNPEAIKKISQEDFELQQHIDKDIPYNEEDDTKEKEDSMNLDNTTVTPQEENDVTETTTIPTNINDDIKKDIPTESQEIEIKTESNMILSTEDDEKLQDINQLQIEDIPLSIPGEGSCLIDGETYSNNTRVATSNECEEYCICVSSVVTCKPVECDSPPSKNCTIDSESKFECCPVYICNDNSEPSKENITEKPSIFEDKDEHTLDQLTTSAPEHSINPQSSIVDHQFESSTLGSNDISHTTIPSTSEDIDGITSNVREEYSSTTKTPIKLSEVVQETEASINTDDSTTMAYEIISNDNIEDNSEGSGSNEKPAVDDERVAHTTIKFTTDEKSSTIAPHIVLGDETTSSNTDDSSRSTTITSEEETESLTTTRAPISDNVSSTKYWPDLFLENNPTETINQVSTDRSPSLAEENHSQTYLPPHKTDDAASNINNDSESATNANLASDEEKLSVTSIPDTFIHEADLEKTTNLPDTSSMEKTTKSPSPKLETTSFVQTSSEIDVTTTPVNLLEEDKHKAPSEQNLAHAEKEESFTTPIFVEENHTEKTNSFPDSDNLFVEEIDATTISSGNVDRNDVVPSSNQQAEINKSIEELSKTTLKPNSGKFDSSSTPKSMIEEDIENPESEQNIMHPLKVDKIDSFMPNAEESTTIASQYESDKEQESHAGESQNGIEELELGSTTQKNKDDQMAYSTESYENVNENNMSDNNVSTNEVETATELHDDKNGVKDQHSPLEIPTESYSHHEVDDSQNTSSEISPHSDEQTTINNEVSFTTESIKMLIDNKIDQHINRTSAESAEKISIAFAATEMPIVSLENKINSNIDVTTPSSTQRYDIEPITDKIGDAIDTKIQNVISMEDTNEHTTAPTTNDEFNYITDAPSNTHNIGEVITTMKSIDSEASNVESEYNNIEEIITTVKTIDSKISSDVESTESKSDSNIDEVTTTVKSIDFKKSPQSETDTNIDEAFTTVKSIDSETPPEIESVTESELDSNNILTTIKSTDFESLPQMESATESKLDTNIDDMLTTVKNIDSEASYKKQNDTDFKSDDEIFTTVKSIDSGDLHEKERDTESKLDTNVDEGYTTVKSIDSEASHEKKSDSEPKLDSNIDEVSTTVKSIDSEVIHENEDDMSTTVRSTDSELPKKDSELPEQEIDTEFKLDTNADEISTTVKSIDSEELPEKEDDTEFKLDTNVNEASSTVKSIDAEAPVKETLDTNADEGSTTVKSIDSEELPDREDGTESKLDTNADEISTTVKSIGSEELSETEDDTESKLDTNANEASTTVKSIDAEAPPKEKIDTNADEASTTVKNIGSEEFPENENDTESELDTNANDASTTVKSIYAEAPVKEKLDTNADESSTTVKSTDSEELPEREDGTEFKPDTNVNEASTTVKNIEPEEPVMKNDTESKPDTNADETSTTVKSIGFEDETEDGTESKLDTNADEISTTVKSTDSEASSENDTELKLDTNVDEVPTTAKTVDSEGSLEKDNDTESKLDTEASTTVNSIDSEGPPKKENDTESKLDTNADEDSTTTKSIDSELVPEKANDSESGSTTVRTINPEAVPNKQDDSETKLDVNIDEIYTTVKYIDSEELSQKESSTESKLESNNEGVFTTVRNVDPEASSEEDIDTKETYLNNLTTVTEVPDANKTVSGPDSDEISNGENIVTEPSFDLINKQTDNSYTKENEFTTVPSYINSGHASNSVEESSTDQSVDSLIPESQNNIIAITPVAEDIQSSSFVPETMKDNSSAQGTEEFATTENIELSEPMKGELNESRIDENVTTENIISISSTNKYRNEVTESESNLVYTTSSPDNKIEEMLIEDIDTIVTTESNNNVHDTPFEQPLPETSNNSMVDVSNAYNNKPENDTDIPVSNINITENPNIILGDETTQNPNIDDRLPHNEEHQNISNEELTTQNYQSAIEQSHNMVEVETTSPSINRNDSEVIVDDIAPMTINTQDKPNKTDGESVDSSKVDTELTTASPAMISKVTEASPVDKKGSYNTASTIPQSTYSTLPQTGMYAPPQYSSYPEDEYTDEDESVIFGPGTCRYGGKLYVSAQQIPRDDPCDFCFCFRSDIICLQQSCPPPISGCREEPIHGFCCPRYECPVSMGTVMNITTSTTSTTTTLPPHFLSHNYHGSATKSGCFINGITYKIGDEITSSSGPCMQCLCGGDGQMKCSPKVCSPEPLMRQMVAHAIANKR